MLTRYRYVDDNLGCICMLPTFVREVKGFNKMCFKRARCASFCEQDKNWTRSKERDRAYIFERVDGEFLSNCFYYKKLYKILRLK